MTYYGYDEEERKIRINMKIDPSAKMVGPFYANLIGSQPLNIVDTLHGFFKNCQVTKMSFWRHGSTLAPHARIEIDAATLDPWVGNIPLESFASSEEDRGMWGNSPPASIGPSDVKVRGIALETGYHYSNQSPVDDKMTSSVIMDARSDGSVSVKQIIHLPNFLRGMEPSDPQVLQNLKGRFSFEERDVDIPRVGEVRTTLVSSEWGGGLRVPVFNPKLTDLTYIFQRMEFPDQDKAEKSDRSHTIPYRVYYEGTLTHR